MRGYAASGHRSSETAVLHHPLSRHHAYHGPEERRDFRILIRREEMNRIAFALLAGMCCASANSQTLPAGPKVSVTMATQPGPGLPQFTKVDVPMLREGVA